MNCQYQNRDEPLGVWNVVATIEREMAVSKSYHAFTPIHLWLLSHSLIDTAYSHQVDTVE